MKSWELSLLTICTGATTEQAAKEKAKCEKQTKPTNPLSLATKQNHQKKQLLWHQTSSRSVQTASSPGLIFLILRLDRCIYGPICFCSVAIFPESFPIHLGKQYLDGCIYIQCRRFTTKWKLSASGISNLRPLGDANFHQRMTVIWTDIPSCEENQTVTQLSHVPLPKLLACVTDQLMLRSTSTFSILKALWRSPQIDGSRLSCHLIACHRIFARGSKWLMIVSVQRTVIAGMYIGAGRGSLPTHTPTARSSINARQRKPRLPCLHSNTQPVWQSPRWWWWCGCSGLVALQMWCESFSFIPLVLTRLLPISPRSLSFIGDHDRAVCLRRGRV